MEHDIPQGSIVEFTISNVTTPTRASAGGYNTTVTTLSKHLQVIAVSYTHLTLPTT